MDEERAAGDETDAVGELRPSAAIRRASNRPPSRHQGMRWNPKGGDDQGDEGFAHERLEDTVRATAAVVGAEPSATGDGDLRGSGRHRARAASRYEVVTCGLDIDRERSAGIGCDRPDRLPAPSGRPRLERDSFEALRDSR